MSKKQSNVDPRMYQSNPSAIRKRLQAIAATGKDISIEQIPPTIGGASLSQNAVVMARLAVYWYDDAGLATKIHMGPYLPVGSYVHYNLGGEGVPSGSIVSFDLDIDAAGDEGSTQLFTYLAVGSVEAHWEASGTLGFEEFVFVGYDPIGRKHRK